jgi:hypothetical protein
MRELEQHMPDVHTWQLAQDRKVFFFFFSGGFILLSRMGKLGYNSIARAFIKKGRMRLRVWGESREHTGVFSAFFSFLLSHSLSLFLPWTWMNRHSSLGTKEREKYKKMMFDLYSLCSGRFRVWNPGRQRDSCALVIQKISPQDFSEGFNLLSASSRFNVSRGEHPRPTAAVSTVADGS